MPWTHLLASAFLHELGPSALSPPAELVWHCPQTPTLTGMVPRALALFPQNGFVATAPVPVVHEVPVHLKITDIVYIGYIDN